VAATAVFALLGFFQLDAILAGTLAQTGPTLFQPGSGGAPLPPNRAVCWSEPPDLEGFGLSSEIIAIYGLETEVANDFVFDADRVIRRVRWWGEYWENTTPCEAGIVPPGFYLRVYHDFDCLPDEGEHGDPYAEYFAEGPAGEAFVACREDQFPIYSYEWDVEIPISAGVRYWMSIQMADHGFPPQWGRLTTETTTGCVSAFGGGWLEPPWWMTVTDVVGFPVDFSQEFECDTPVAVQQSSWGRIRALYR
jgi:hypothetical protein